MEKPQPWLFLQSTFPQNADIIVHLFFVFVIHTRQQVKHEMNSYRLHNIEIAYSNFTFCGAQTPSLYSFRWKMWKFQENKHTPVKGLRWRTPREHRLIEHEFLYQEALLKLGPENVMIIFQNHNILTLEFGNQN